MHDDASSVIPCDEALRVARIDAETVYRDLWRYRITMRMENERWHVDFHVNSRMNGGGPHYVIHAYSGDIIHKRYEQ